MVKKIDIDYIGTIAKLPKNTSVTNAYTFMDKIKIPKNKIWYILVQEQEDKLQMVKYNRVEGVDLEKFITNLKSYYLNKYIDNETIYESIKKIEVIGEDKFSIIKNISSIIIDDKPLITKITEDLIKLLAI